MLPRYVLVAFAVVFNKGITNRQDQRSISSQKLTPNDDFTVTTGRAPSRSSEQQADQHVSTGLSRAAFVTTLLSIPAVALAKDGDGRLSSIKNSQPSSSSSSSSVQLSRSEAKDESISGFVAGAALAFTKTLVKYPLDTATVRLQMPNSQYSIFNPQELFSGSYNGVLPPLLVNVPGAAIFFAVKDASKAVLKGSFPDLPKYATTMAAVAVAQIPYWIVRTPSEVVKTRQQARIEGYYGEGISDLDSYKRVIEDVKARDGTSNEAESNNATQYGAIIREFYTGYYENIIYAYPADVIKFVAYEQITQGKKNLSPAEGAIAGAFATAIAQFITTPLDVVRNRIMAKIEKSSDTDPQLSYLETLSKLAKEEGMPGLFAGATPRVGKAFISGAIQFATYEETKQAIANLILQRKD